MEAGITFVGLDVHKEAIAVAALAYGIVASPDCCKSWRVAEVDAEGGQVVGQAGGRTTRLSGARVLPLQFGDEAAQAGPRLLRPGGEISPRSP